MLVLLLALLTSRPGPASAPAVVPPARILGGRTWHAGKVAAPNLWSYWHAAA